MASRLGRRSQRREQARAPTAGGRAESRIFVDDVPADENKLSVEDPDQPGTPLGGIESGTPGAIIETHCASLGVSNSSVVDHGARSAVLDVK